METAEQILERRLEIARDDVRAEMRRDPSQDPSDVAHELADTIAYSDDGRRMRAAPVVVADEYGNAGELAAPGATLEEMLTASLYGHLRRELEETGRETLAELAAAGETLELLELEETLERTPARNAGDGPDYTAARVVGLTAAGAPVTVSVRATETRRGLELAFTADAGEHGAGAMVDRIRATVETLAPEVTRGELAELEGLAQRWHLNALRARDVAGERAGVARAPGRAWYFEPVPEYVLELLAHVFPELAAIAGEMDRGTAPAPMRVASA